MTPQGSDTLGLAPPPQLSRRTWQGRRKLDLPGVLAELMQPQTALRARRQKEGVRGKAGVYHPPSQGGWGPPAQGA